MDNDFLDITPDPKILVALSRTPLAPLDALCELVDNAIDSFAAAESQGIKVPGPLVQLSLPGATEVSRGEGAVQIRDNGAGLTIEEIRNALRAGWTNKNPFDTLGLFGMGFNIATSKLGQNTVVTTARAADDFALQATLDIPNLLRAHAFRVPVEKIDKPAGLDHGTVVEVRRWWPEGDPNRGFIAKLASLSRPSVRDALGRRYATMLRGRPEDRLRLQVNREAVTPFEHCVWSEDRFVERRDQRVPAQIHFDKTLHTQRRCAVDGSVLLTDETECPECGGQAVRMVEERVRGWIGVQRFDDLDQFGIDLIRNGRAIKVGEKQAFFVHVDEVSKEEQREYPIDQTFGRIVGEVHLDHVPVDFQKQDFQRATDEWSRAIAFLRGGSLLPSKWQDVTNESPVSRIFQGYRKVRSGGRAEMYMGRYNVAKGKSERVGRDVEREYYRRFLNHEDGYRDDARWWDLVETATVPPVQELPECPECLFQNSPEAETCESCGKVLLGTPCRSCGTEIPISAVTCPTCGSSQIVEVEEPWTCKVCSHVNGVDDENCQECGSVRGAQNPASPDALRQLGSLRPELSFQNEAFKLADGTRSAPLTAETLHVSVELRPVWNGATVPLLAFRETGTMTVFVHEGHSAFADYALRPEVLIAIEVGQYLYDYNRHLIGRPTHTVNNLAYTVLAQCWSDNFVESSSELRESIERLFQQLADRLQGSPYAADFYKDLGPEQQKYLADSLIGSGVPLEELAVLKDSGSYFSYLDPGSMVQYFVQHPDAWFGTVWSDELPDSDLLGAAVAERGRAELVNKYERCLEDVASYVRYRNPEPLIVIRSRASRDFLEDKLS